jgi:hypothetical protein
MGWGISLYNMLKSAWSHMWTHMWMLCFCCCFMYKFITGW